MNNLIINGIKRLENSIREVRRDYSPEQLVKINDFVSSYDEMTLQLFNDCISNAAYMLISRLFEQKNKGISQIKLINIIKQLK